MTKTEMIKVLKAISLLNTMVCCKEDHNAESLRLTKEAFEIIRFCIKEEETK